LDVFEKLDRIDETLSSLGAGAGRIGTVADDEKIDLMFCYTWEQFGLIT